MAKKDYYETLGINKNASQEEVKKAFKQLARKWHPDVHPDKKQAEEKFKEINEAFQVLNNPGKRQQYDQFGTADFNGQSSGQGFGRGFDFNDIFRNFEDLFGGFGFRNREEENFDLRYNLEISLEDSFKGVKKTIEVSQLSNCVTCNGQGAKPEFIKECKDCEGTGEYRRVQRTVFGQVVSVSTCTKCSGIGKTITKSCEKCDGKGKLKKNKKIEIEIPKGADNEQYLKVQTDSGNVFVIINIKKHEIFDRDEENLFCKTTIDLATAILGGEVDIPNISGKTKLTIPSGTQSPTVFRLKGQGMPSLHSNKRGDQLVKVVVNIPEKLTKKQQELLKEAFSDKQVETKKGFFEKLREFV